MSENLPRRSRPRPTPFARSRPRDDGKPRCEFCQVEVFWAFPVPSTKGRGGAANDKPRPFDAAPDPSGKFSCYRDGDRMLYAELAPGMLAGWRADGRPTYTPHFKTCVKAHDWGKAGKAYGGGTIQR